MRKNVLRVRKNVLMVDNAWQNSSGVISSWIVQMVLMKETVVSVHKLYVRACGGARARACVHWVKVQVGYCLCPPSLHDPGQFLIPLVLYIWFLIVPFAWINPSMDKGIEFMYPITYVPELHERCSGF